MFMQLVAGLLLFLSGAVLSGSNQPLLGGAVSLFGLVLMVFNPPGRPTRASARTSSTDDGSYLWYGSYLWFGGSGAGGGDCDSDGDGDCGDGGDGGGDGGGE